MNINVTRFAAVVAASLSLCAGEAWGTDTNRNLPPKCKDPDKKCDCPGQEVEDGCIKVTIDLGETTPWTGSIPCELKIFADNDSPLIFTADSLYAILGGYTFKRLGTQNLSDGATPAEVVLSRKNGEAVHFVFRDGESMARPDPGIHIKMDERLQMVDAEGWATASDPVYYDLYVGDGTRRRFLASDMTGALGSLVSITDARGVTATPEEMRIDIVYDSNGVRQFLTPSRLADITLAADFSGYDVTVYALQEAPAKDAQTRLYTLPAGLPVEVISIRRENDGKRAVVTQRKGGGETKRYVFDYAMGDWSLRRPSGMEERKERYIADEKDAKVIEEVFSAAGVRLSRTEYNYKWESWGFALTNKVEGFDGLTNITTWTYYTSGNGKGQVKTEKRQSGLLTQYTYDSLDRVISETRSGPGMMTEMTTYDYTPVDPSDPVLPVDTRPRTIVKKLNNIECERTYYVYSPLTNIVERVGAQGAAYGGTNALRTVTAYYPVVANDARSGFIASIRREDGRLDIYDYSLSSNVWTRTVTHLHEQAPSPVSGKTTRDVALTNARGETIEERTEAFIEGAWHVIARERRTYNAEGKVVQRENLAGQVTTTAWDCCHKISEVQPDGSTTTWDYDDEGRTIASSRLIPLDMTNVTWLTTCYAYDDLGRQVATWQTNFAAQVGLPAERTAYDALGRVVARVDRLGNTTTTTYSSDGRTVSVLNPNTSTLVTSRSAEGDTLSITGTAATPEFHTYGILPDGTRWSRTVQGETASSPRFTKRYENLLGQTIREERSGFRGAVLATVHSYDSLGRLVTTVADYEPTVEYTYDTLGNRIATTRSVGASDPARPSEWRKTETLSSFVLDDSIVWLTQTNIVSCSDSSIAPLVTSSAHQLTGLSAAFPSRSRSTDVRGNVTVNETLVDLSLVTARQTLPYATNRVEAVIRYGLPLLEVSSSCVAQTRLYDLLGRQISTIDGRGFSTFTEYNSKGEVSTFRDLGGGSTAYSYDSLGNLVSLTDPLGNKIVYEYDQQGRKAYEGGATYPIRYTYDVFGNKTGTTTYRNESFGLDSGDVTTWLYDSASAVVTNKLYADGKGTKYDYDDYGRLTKRTWARGIATTYAYDLWGSLSRMDYSDGTHSVVFSRDAMGRQTRVIDGAGVTTFAYDAFGAITNETVIGVAGTNVLERCYDSFGRYVGYALNGVQQSTLSYDLSTGRLATMCCAGSDAPFTWGYLDGTDLKSSLAYPNRLVAKWTYGNLGELQEVDNTSLAGTVSKYVYTYDAVGRRIFCFKSGSSFEVNDADSFRYNVRGELTNVTSVADSNYHYSYSFDDIGNRKCANMRGEDVTYAANTLNQYTRIGDFEPRFDADGNQILVRTSTGIWSVVYNGENRPVLWTCVTSEVQTISSQTTISMSYDRIGRRVEYLETTKNDQGATVTNAHHRFTYDGYLCNQRLNACANNSIDMTFTWDPTELVATRLLRIAIPNDCILYVAHDGNKNVTDLVPSNGARAIEHYEYTPFGGPRIVVNDSALSNGNAKSISPIQYSSEYYDATLGLVSYNFRNLLPEVGRWMSRDPLSEVGSAVLTPAIKDFDKGIDSSDYQFVENDPIGEFDVIGLAPCNCYLEATCKAWCDSEIAKEGMIGGYTKCNLTWFGWVMTCKCWGWCEDNFMTKPPVSKYDKWECSYRCGFRTAHFRLDRPCPKRFPIRLPMD